MTHPPATAGLTAPQLCRAVSVTYRQLDYWARTDLLRPSLSEARGSGTQRRYSLDDARVALTMRRLLDSGMSLQSVRGAMSYVRDPEGCDLLYIGASAFGVCGVDALGEVVAGCGGLVTVIDLRNIADDLARALAATTRPPTPSDEMRRAWGQEAG